MKFENRTVEQHWRCCSRRLKRRRRVALCALVDKRTAHWFRRRIRIRADERTARARAGERARIGARIFWRHADGGARVRVGGRGRGRRVGVQQAANLVDQGAVLALLGAQRHVAQVALALARQIGHAAMRRLAAPRAHANGRFARRNWFFLYL